uniref:Uncharacterized protein n=2 Tax=unclassified Caudoviricetes TaxID=2788787 RepID=A0A8S5MA59_9CAUD|nr:MAG TPA: hypothetical protein [Siphoviridae sp. ctsDY37]DAF96046.1 MAG TPA: hypothetical protein [Siphoviridae sp. cteLB10]
MILEKRNKSPMWVQCKGSKCNPSFFNAVQDGSR